MIPDTVIICAIWLGAVALILYWCWADARKKEGADYILEAKRAFVEAANWGPYTKERIMDKTMLVRLSDKTSFDPSRVMLVNLDGRRAGGAPCVTVFFTDDLRYETFTGDEMEAFKRWHADHSTGDYLGEKAPF